VAAKRGLTLRQKRPKQKKGSALESILIGLPSVPRQVEDGDNVSSEPDHQWRNYRFEPRGQNLAELKGPTGHPSGDTGQQS